MSKQKSKKTYQQEIGGVVSHLRTDKGMTQAELAKALGTSQPTIYRIERGRQNVSLDMVRKLSKALGSPILSVNTSVSQSLYIKVERNFTAKLQLTHPKTPLLACFVLAY